MGKWRGICKKSFIILMACILAGAGTLSNRIQVHATENLTTKYEIYPIPHDITYGDSQAAITKNVNAVFEQSIDDATKKRTNEIITSIGSTVEVSDNVLEGKSNIFVGTYDSKGVVDTYMQEHYDIDEDLFKKMDSNVVIVDKGNIFVLGKDTNAAFYGLTSLKYVFKQLENGTIRDFVIKDYADTKTRGFIEGYYGIPWTNADRMSLMKFGGDLKMTSYVFAPKDDPYHTTKWRDLYPDAELNAVKEMVQVGIDTKCRFVWTAHPFMGGFNATQKDQEIAKLLAKFDQLYAAGVRQFGVLGDDVGGLDRAVVVDIMKAVSEWGIAKGDVFDPVFCPAGYNDAWAGDYSELNDYDAGFPENVQIFWTGQAVCQPVEQKTLTNFKTKNLPAGQTTPRRNPLFWLNWPVNDINMSRLAMGKGSLLHTDVNINDLSGVVSNPMQDAEPSKVALFAVADYAWNVKAFNDDKSWEDSFKYIDNDASEELHILAKHMSDPAPNGHGLVLDESEDIKPLLEQFKTKLANGESVKEIGQTLIAEYNVIIEACDGFQAKSQNARMKEQILPFSDSLKELASGSISLIETAIALEDGDDNLVWINYSEALAKLEASEVHFRKTLNGTAAAMPGAKRLRPFAEFVKGSISSSVGSILDPSKVIVKVVTNREDIPEGGLESINDGNKGTAAIFKSPNSSKVGEYLGLTYNNSVHIKDVNVYIGNSGNSKDFFTKSKIQYTEDGKTWIDINDKIYTNNGGDIHIKDLDLDVKGVRVIATEANDNVWVSCKEITINETEEKPEDDSTVIPNTLFVTPGYSSYSGDLSNITDRDDNTFVWFKMDGNSSKADDFIGVDLGEQVKLGNIHFTVGGTSDSDYWTNYDLEYSTDNVTYTKLESYTQSEAKKVVDFDATKSGVKARYVRLRNTKTTGKWVQISELHVDKASVLKAYTNAASCEDIEKKVTLSKTSLEETNNITLKSNEYVGVVLTRIKDLTKINTIENNKLILETSKNGYVWTTVEDVNKPETAKYVRLINKSKEDVTFDLTKFEVLSNEIEPKSLVSSTFGTPINALAVFDKDRTTRVSYESSQSKGKNFVYDLGQTIELNSLKAVCNDGEWDFARHGKFSVSEDGKTWTDIMYLGNQDGENENESTSTDDITSVLPVHETSYNTKEVRDLKQKARYLKFEITRTKVGADKWLAFNELEINDGQYIPSENDPTVTTSAPVVEGKEPKKVIDGDVSSVFTPGDNAAGELIYNISASTRISRITILQSPSTISNAKVYVYAPSRIDMSIYEWQEVGILNQSLNQFSVAAYRSVAAIKIAWAENSAPTLNEIFTLENTSTTIDKSFLEAAILSAKNIDKSLYTTDTYNTVTAKLKTAEDMFAKVDATEDQVFEAENGLRNAIAALLERADISSLRTEVDKANDLNKNKYTVSTWNKYEKALNAAKTVIKDNSNVTQNTADALLKTLQNAYVGLKEDTTIIKTTLKSVINKAKYAETSGQLDKLTPTAAALIRSQLVLAEAVYANEDATIEQCLNAWFNLAEALRDLDFVADKALLFELIKSCEEIDVEDYLEGVAEYTAALANAKTIYENPNASQANIQSAYTRLDNAIMNLVMKKNADKTVLQLMIDRIKETIGSGSKYKKDDNWNTFVRALEKADNVLADKKATQLDVNTAITELGNAYMNIHLLNNEKILAQLTAFINRANSIDRALYSVEQLKIIDETVNKAKAMLVNYNENEISTLLDEIAKALNIIDNPQLKPDNKIDTPTKDNTNTGDETNTSLLWGIMLVTGGVVLECIRRRRQASK